MGKRASHAPGTFSWVDLACGDPAAAKSFYGDLFKWEMSDDDAGGRPYTTCRIEGDAVSGLYGMPEEAGTGGGAPGWMSYLTVEDAAACALRAQELGAATVRAPFEIGDFGRAAVLRDPEGAAFAVWQPAASIGAERVNDVGCLCMNSLVTTAIDASRSFYEGLFGWTTEPAEPEGESQMILVLNEGRLNASIVPRDPGEPNHWCPYFTVQSTEEAVERVGELGGERAVGPMEIFDGSIATVLDPQGARFGLFEGEVDP